MTDKIKNALSCAKHKTLDLIYNTHIEIGIGAAVFTVVAATLAHNHNMDRAKVRPVALSEFGKTAMAYAKRDEEVPPLTRFYSRCSDPTMKFNEALNYKP